MLEVLLVCERRVNTDFDGDGKRSVDRRTLNQANLFRLNSDGQGFRCIGNSVLREIKQGSCIGSDEKERF